MLRPFAYFAPQTVAEALAIYHERSPSVRLLAGGTALLVALERRQTTAATLIDLAHIKQLHGIQVTAAGEVKIGSLVTLRELIDSPLLQDRAPVLAHTAQQMATPQVRNLGTVGGNIASGLAAADLATSLLALDADLLLTTAAGEQRLSLDQFLAQSVQPTPPAPGIISAIVLPIQTGQASYQKLMVRRAADVALANVAVWVQAESGQLAQIRIAAGGYNGRPARLREVESALRSQAIMPELATRAAATAAETVVQDGDWRASAAYRRRMVGVLLQRALEQLFRFS